MSDFFAILFTCACGIFAATAFTAAHESRSDRRARRRTERWIRDTYPPTY
jgi:hypothetical protein